MDITYYNYKMDIWGLGWVFFEILALGPLFPGDDEIDEIDEVNKINYIKKVRLKDIN